MKLQALPPLLFRYIPADWFAELDRVDALRRPLAPAFAPTIRDKLGMTVMKFFANHSVWSINNGLAATENLFGNNSIYWFRDYRKSISE